MKLKNFLYYHPLTCSSILLLLVTSFFLLPLKKTTANPPLDNSDIKASPHRVDPVTAKQSRRFSKNIDQPNPKDFQRLRERRRLMEKMERQKVTGETAGGSLLSQELARLKATATSGTDKVLVILVEFDGTDKFLWTPGVSTWDPMGKCNSNEYTGQVGTVAATANIRSIYNLNTPTTFTYTGPLHNAIERPLSESDASGNSIWTPDFSTSTYTNLIFGNGITLNYNRQDNSTVNESFIGSSVNKYYEDLSAGRYHITGEVVGWVKVPHSVWWYGADPAPGSRSGIRTNFDGGIPGAGNSKTLVVDAINAVKAKYPNFNWKQYDIDGDGVIDRLWIIYAGLGEEDNTTLLNRTDYGEGGIWSHSSSISPYPVYADGTTTITAGPYIMMAENCGIGVLAHEYGHNLGALDLYSYSDGDTSAGFWTIMADDWTGYPIGFLPPAFDPYHLDLWGWLDPLVITDPRKPVTVTIGQPSAFPGGKDVNRGAKIVLPDGKIPLSVKPIGSYQWWGGQDNNSNGLMIKKTPLAIPSSGSTTLTFSAAFNIETGYDFLWVEVSINNGASWIPLTNSHTTSTHATGWIGGNYGFPQDLAAAGMGGFSGKSASWPNYQTENFSLAPFKGKSILIGFWYMTDWNTLYDGPFIDNIVIKNGSTTLFSDNAESGDAKWTYSAPWERNDGFKRYTHNYYLQWRNVSPTGGYDRSLSDSRWRFGPANTGLLVWYNNNLYTDNEILYYLQDSPGFGPKGVMLVVDAHPEPYRDPYVVTNGYPNEAANLFTRSLMRDAPFSLLKAVDFQMSASYVHDPATIFTGYPAVNQFSDSLGYYPGAEFVSRGPAYNPPNKWITKQWDASVVLPSTEFYGIKAPGYTMNEELRYGASVYAGGAISAYVIPKGLGYNGGTGNPGDVSGQYGWNVRIMSQTATTASITVWNSNYIKNDAKGWETYK